MKDYNLSFEEALKCVLNDEGWVQGDDFAKGVVLRLGGFSDCVEVCCFGGGDIFTTNGFPLRVTKRCYQQKYRVVHSQPEALRNKD